MTKLNEHIGMTELAHIVMHALKSASKADFWPYHWTFTNKSGDTRVEYIVSKEETKYVLTRAKKFLGFTTGHESITLSSNSPELDMPLWHQLGDVLYNSAARFGVNG